MCLAHIILVEDDEVLAVSLKDYLQKADFKVSLYQDPALIDLANLDKWDLMILDLILPNIPGEEVLKKVKSHYPDFPVLILTAKGQIENKKECFELGADDYLVKPFDILELNLRIKALLRRSRKEKKIILDSDTIIDLSKGLILKKGKEIIPSQRAWSLLLYLLENRGRIVSKKEILAHVWPDAVVTEESIRAYIKELRKILPGDKIQTIRGRGYRLK